MPHFSIIIPVYNVASYLIECLDSILKQDYIDYEICITDDGSTDGSGEICDFYVSKYPNSIKLIHTINQGVSAARNTALDLASGKYIWFVDSDDWISQDSLNYLDKIIKKSECDTIFFGNKVRGNNSSYTFKYCDKSKYLCENLCYCNPLMIFSRKIIEENNLRFSQGMKMAEDLEFQYKYLLHISNPVSIEYNFYKIRIRANSASRNSEFSEINNFYGHKQLLLNMIEYLNHSPEKGFSWMSLRLQNSFKGLLQSSSKISTVSKKETKDLLNNLLQSYNQIGFKNLCDCTLLIAKYNMTLYYLLLKIYIKILKRL